LVEFEMTSPLNELVEVKVFDVNGRQLLSKEEGWQGPRTVLDLSGFGAGVYWLKATIRGKSIQERIVKL